MSSNIERIDVGEPEAPNALDPTFPFLIAKSARPLASSPLYQFLIITDEGAAYPAKRSTKTAAGRLLVLHPHADGSRHLLWRGLLILFGRRFLDQISVACWDDRLMRILEVPKDDRRGKPLSLTLPPSLFPALRTAACQIFDEHRARRSGYRSMIRLKFLELLLLIFRTGVTNEGAGEKRLTWTMERIIDYIEGNSADRFSLKDLAARTGIHPGSLSRSFKESTGSSLFEYINRIRIRKSCLLLKRSRLSILDIGMSVGYNNISFFNRYFRRIMGMSPGEYRKLSRR
jgi:AraC-like DNA-binding protein